VSEANATRISGEQTWYVKREVDLHITWTSLGPDLDLTVARLVFHKTRSPPTLRRAIWTSPAGLLPTSWWSVLSGQAQTAPYF